jgi:hypothetical protein
MGERSFFCGFRAANWSPLTIALSVFSAAQPQTLVAEHDFDAQVR